MQWFKNQFLALWAFVQSIFIDPFRLRIYGAEQLTSRTASELSWFTWPLVGQFVLDFWAWTTVWAYGLPGTPWPLWFGLAFAGAILVLDRSIIVADTSASRASWIPLLGRIVIVLFLSGLTAVAVELSVFGPEINNRLDANQKEQVDAILADAEATEGSAYGERIQSIRDESASVTGSATAQANADLQTYQNDRSVARGLIVARHNEQRNSITARLTQLEQTIQLESAGRGPSGRYGDGPAVAVMRQQRETLVAELAAFETASAEELRVFDQETSSEVTRRQQVRDTTLNTATDDAQTRIDTLEREREEKIIELRELALTNPALLAARYGGTYVQSRGILDRYKELMLMAHGDGTEKNPGSLVVRVIIWGCRTIMMVLPMLVLFLKLRTSEPTKLYFSDRNHVLAGNAKSIEVYRALGLAVDGTDAVPLGWTPEMRDAYEHLAKAWLEYAGRFRKFSEEKARLARARTNVGLPQTLKSITTELHAFWLKQDGVAKAIDEVYKATNELRHRAIPVPPWPTELNVPEPDHVTTPWEVSMKEMERLGWEDPEPLITAAKTARTEYSEQLRTLRTLLLRDYPRELREAVRASSSQETLEDLRFDFYQDRVMPVMTKIEDLEGIIRTGGQDLPEWPKSIPDPRKTESGQLWQVNETLWELDPRTLAQVQPTKVCSNCRMEIPANAAFCGDCGASQTPANPVSP